jgi:hypothetical protein
MNHVYVISHGDYFTVVDGQSTEAVDFHILHRYLFDCGYTAEQVVEIDGPDMYELPKAVEDLTYDDIKGYLP